MLWASGTQQKGLTGGPCLGLPYGKHTRNAAQLTGSLPGTHTKHWRQEYQKFKVILGRTLEGPKLSSPLGSGDHTLEHKGWVSKPSKATKKRHHGGNLLDPQLMETFCFFTVRNGGCFLLCSPGLWPLTCMRRRSQWRSPGEWIIKYVLCAYSGTLFRCDEKMKYVICRKKDGTVKY